MRRLLRSRRKFKLVQPVLPHKSVRFFVDWPAATQNDGSMEELVADDPSTVSQEEGKKGKLPKPSFSSRYKGKKHSEETIALHRADPVATIPRYPVVTSHIRIPDVLLEHSGP